MTWSPVPWMVDGGLHPSEVGRTLAYQALGGAEGVGGINDLKVRPLAVPGRGFRVAGGTASMLNRYAGWPEGGQQMYVGRNAGDDIVNHDMATGSGGGRSDLVVARVLDPQYGAQPPTNPSAGPYIATQVITGVPSNTKRAEDVASITYPAIALARIDYPASTSTISAGMIVDLRKVARPRRERYVRTYALAAGEEDILTTTVSGGETWPNVELAAWYVDVPRWATAARIVATWGSVKVPPGNAYGTIWARVGGGTTFAATDTVFWDTPGSADQGRQTFTLGGEITIPAALRGTQQQLRMYGRLTAGAAAARPRLDAGSSIVYDIEFLERADLA